ncbi:ABC transporter substrate-binding protein [Reinekea blandensis]|uniref:ABC alpha-glucoside transporter, perplasmic substrate-binding protein n=1 Tax=Reinekea blandensis MED297 TaxID=314283 RepID=A4BK37_9GAMM|nr:ABC transporter substrate-binding protein [Reinekea blandensis]EAR07519.1 ABC alpha-glucoside transporter, perplasmic substrate-binding protein [Reinekea sp. MED297] [Reinekea blandensis MED297]
MKNWQKTSLAIALATATAGAAFAAGHAAPTRGSGAYSWDSLAQFDSMDLSGVTVTVAGPWLAPEDDYIRRVFEPFEQATGAVIEYNGSDSFEQQILIDAQAGTPPNVAFFPQPGLASDMASRGYLTPVSDDVRETVLENYAAGQSWVDLATYDNENDQKDFYGVFYRADVKSLVWYSPDNFADYGYDVPDTMEELIELTEQIAADGETPWCIGLGSGAATGWPATDWIEDIMLRTQPPEVYDEWVSHEMRFNDARVTKAIETFGFFAKNDDFVAGGAEAVGTTDFRDSPKDLFSVPPKCFMHRQASFIPAFFPEGTVVGEDVDFFYFPAYESKDLGKPVLGAGTVAGITKSNEATEAVLAYLLTPLAHELWMEKGNFLTANTKVNTDLYASETQKALGDILLNATTFRFDGSDLMPGAIGAGAFWTGMVDYVSGKSAQRVANEIEQSWKEIE